MDKNNNRSNLLVLWVRLSRPLFLLGAALLYAMGVGIARYLGVSINWNLYLIGQAWVTMLQLSTHFLNEYFDALGDADNLNRTPFSGGSGLLGPGGMPRRVALLSGLVCLAGVASLTVLLIISGRPAPAVYLMMILAFLGSFFYSTPPVSLESTGYGELTTSVLVAYLVPAFGFILQTGELHRLVAMSAFPLTVLHLSMLVTFELPDYANDIKHNKRTLLVRIGWQNGMVLHNLLVLSAFVALGLAALFGLPRFVALPAFLTLPLGLLEIWQMRRIAGGGKPNWTALTLNAVAMFAVMAYLFTYTFWTH
ncbi:MAG TPA: prenyltransferase [Anaerolineales bacterium]